MFENFTVKQFEQAWFKKDRSVISEDDFKIVYSEYQDTSGLFLTDDFEKRSYVLHLYQRNNYVKLFIEFQREFIRSFSMPFLRLEDLLSFKNKYGYVLKWNSDLEDFEDQLQTIESREIKFETTLDEKLKDIKDSREKKSNVNSDESYEVSTKNTRVSWLRMINSLNKLNYKIDKPVTTVEELSLMIKQQMEEVDDQLNRTQNGR